MASLTDKRIKNTYDGLLKTTDNDPLGGSYKLITDGLGNSSGVYLGTGGSVGINVSSPSYKLHVGGTTGIQGNVEIDGDLEVAQGFGGDRCLFINTSTGAFEIGDTAGIGDFAFISGDSSSLSMNVNQTVGLHIDVNARVGIGTDSPGAKLTVLKDGTQASSVSSTYQIQTVSNANGGIAIQAGANSKAYLVFGDNGDYDAGRIAYSNSSHALGFYTNNSEKLTILSGGNVGIGTTSPSTKFQISTSMSSGPTSNIFLDVDGANTNGGGGSIIFGTSATAGTTNTYNAKITGTRVAGQGGDSELGFWTTLVSDSTNPQQRMTITKEGNVGIGTTSPGSLLHLESDSPKIQFTDTTTNASSYIDADSGFGSISIAADHGNNVANSQINLMVDGVSKMVIKNTGNVGIGTTSPAYKLDVNGSASFDNAAIIDGLDTGNPTPAVEQTRISGYGIIGNRGSFYITNASSIGTIYWGIGGNHNAGKKMTLRSTGNLGIGTTTPAEKLHVVGNIQINDHDGTGNLQIGASDGAGNDAIIGMAARNSSNGISPKVELRTIYDSSGGANGSAFTISTRSGSGLAEKMRIDSSGNVGIGTTSPEEKLHVSGTTKSSTFKTGAGSIVITGQEIYANDEYTGNDGAIRLNRFGYQGGQTRFRDVDIFDGKGTSIIKVDGSSGNVGIGTTSPGAKLHVSTGNDSNSGNIEFVIGGTNLSNARTASLIKNTSSPYELTIQSSNNPTGSSHLIFKTSGSDERMRIDSAGNVGIGLTGPRTKLHVSGITGDDDPSLGASTAPFFVSNTANSYGLNVGVNNQGRAWLQAQSNTSAISYDILLNPLGGNVGIGTSSPNSKLHVIGDNPVININDSNSTTRYAALNLSTAGGTWRISSGDSTTGTSSNLFITRADDGTSNRFIFDRDLYYFGVYDNTNTQKVRLRASGNSYFDGGNVGIGTTSPDRLLVLNHASDTRVKLQVNGTDTAQIQTLTNEARYHALGSSTSLQLWTNGAERARIDTSGNVGIGTTSPNTTLEVGDCDSSTFIDDGNIAVKTKSNNTAIVIQEASGAEQWGLGVHADGDLIFTDSGTERIRFDDDTGNVGIGTGAPAVKLHTFEANDNWIYVETSGTNAIGGLRTQSSTGSRQNTLYRNVTTNLLTLRSGTDDGEIQFIAGGSASERMRIAADGGLFVYDLLGSSASNPDVRYNTTTGELYYNSSSIRYKEDVTDIESTIDKINKLRPVKFKVKESQQYTTGLIAEEVVDVLPELVFKKQIEGFEEPQIDGVAYNDLHAYYIKAIQEQQEMINELKTEIQTLKSQINS